METQQPASARLRALPVRRLLAVAGIVALLATLAPAVSASSAKAFHLEKTCVSNILCTVQADTFGSIPAGTDVNYTIDATRPWLAYPTIVVRNGSTTGVCDWNQPGPDVLAICSFGSGTGRLTQFHLVVDVSVDADNLWHWDGVYWFGPGH
jgi:hypothetical protein